MLTTCQTGLQSTIKNYQSTIGLRTPNQYAGDKDQHTAEPDLQRGRNPWTVHITSPDPGDHSQLGDHNHTGSPQRPAEIMNQKRQCVSDTAERSHCSADQTARPRMSSSCKASIVGKRFGKSHADSRADRCGESHPESIPAIRGGKRCGED